jgi:peptide/nickel transport system ATP-binding protein
MSARAKSQESNVLEVRGLTVEYATDSVPVVAVDGVDLDVTAGEFVGVVGESGCGKSTLLFAIARLLSPPAAITAGSIVFKGHNLIAMTQKQLNALRWRDCSLVMQSAMNALNPITTIGAQFRDVAHAHMDWSPDEVTERSAEVLRHATAHHDRDGTAFHAGPGDHGRADVRA